MKKPRLFPELKNLETIHDGMRLAELDLTIRGSGELYGTRQSGRWNLKVADLTDRELIEKAREQAMKLLSESPNLDKYPLLSRKLAVLTKEIAPD